MSYYDDGWRLCDECNEGWTDFGDLEENKKFYGSEAGICPKCDGIYCPSCYKNHKCECEELNKDG